jgi:hypothetical protein
MPNWCSNILKVTGDADEIRNFVVGATDDYNNLSILERYLPVPPAFTADPVVDSDAQDIFIPLTEDSYNWRMKNWGVKWPESEAKIIKREEDIAVIGFSTPWAPPVEGIINISKSFLSLSFLLAFHEDGMGFAGVAHIALGQLVKEYNFSDLLTWRNSTDDNAYDNYRKEVALLFDKMFELTP